MKPLLLATALLLLTAGLVSAGPSLPDAPAPANTPLAAAAAKREAPAVCGPASFKRPECQKAKPAYRHHHLHCYWSGGVQRCT